jgi:poly-gamma-glutamate capsule biosynthesis protein CapA/YwtB (metallophosphatase superfamily)
MERIITNRTSFYLSVVLLLLAAVIWWRVLGPNRRKPQVQLRGSGATLIIAATGGWLTSGAMRSDRTDQGSSGVADILKNASLGLTTLEENLLDEKNIPAAEEQGAPRWLYGTNRDADDLRHVGFTVVSLANNHAADYGVEGLKQTSEILDHQGLLHVGSGEDLQRASAPVYLGAAPRLVAVIGVTTSATSQSRATDAQGDILGRPGANVVRYLPVVTVDPSTFATLKKSSIAMNSPPNKDGNQLTVGRTVIKKGQETSVEFVANDQDVNRVLAQIRVARSKADVVVVALDSHEPSNQSETPAKFVKQLARAAIDAGASIVAGSGAHQLRGIELYRGGAIFYSLGNFAFEYNRVDPRAIDVYDRGLDLFQLALGATGDIETYPVPRLEEPMWWESVIAISNFEHGTLRSIKLQPVDLGADLPIAQRGVPRIATPQHGDEILRRLVRLSHDLGTQIHVENGLGFIDFAR